MLDPKGIPDPVTVRLPTTMRRQLEEAASRRGVCRTEYIRDALKLLLQAERACDPNNRA
jgi:metal-responsive CopG/Arc/MetJ family transcriptional regulator